MPRYSFLLVAPLIASAALALAGGASAATFCVQAPDCPAGGVSTGANLQAALDAAASQPGADTVLVGDKGSPYSGPFTYQSLSRVPDPVTINADRGRPVLTAGVGDTVLTMAAGTLSGIDVSMPSVAEGLGIETQDSTLRDVTVSSDAGGGPGATGIVAKGQSALDHVRITARGDGGLAVRGTNVSGFAANVNAQNVQVSGPVTAVDVDAASRFTATGSQLTGTSLGVSTAGSTELLHDTLATSDPGSIGISESDGSLGLDHVTVAHEGAPSGSDTALATHAASADPFVTVTNSALAGYSHGITRSVSGGHTVSLRVEQSVWNPAGDELGLASAGAVHEVGDQPVEPVLVNLAGGDLRPRGSSAQIDLDTTTDPKSYTDLIAAPAIDGNGDGIVRADAGALEYRRQPPTIDTIDTPGAGAARAQLVFDAAAHDADGDRVTVRWDFGDGTNASGAAATHAYSAPGAYQGTLTAANESGLTVKRAFAVTISPVAPNGTRPGGPNGTRPGGPNGTPPHPTRLVLRGLRLSSGRLSVRRAGSLRLRFTANETATVRIVPSRRTARRAIASRPVVRHVSAGTHAIALATALRKLRLLHPGRLTLTVTASDPSGHHTQPRALHLTLVR